MRYRDGSVYREIFSTAYLLLRIIQSRTFQLDDGLTVVVDIEAAAAAQQTQQAGEAPRYHLVIVDAAVDCAAAPGTASAADAAAQAQGDDETLLRARLQLVLSAVKRRSLTGRVLWTAPRLLRDSFHFMLNKHVRAAYLEGGLASPVGGVVMALVHPRHVPPAVMRRLLCSTAAAAATNGVAAVVAAAAEVTAAIAATAERFCIPSAGCEFDLPLSDTQRTVFVL